MPLPALCMRMCMCMTVCTSRTACGDSSKVRVQQSECLVIIIITAIMVAFALLLLLLLPAEAPESSCLFERLEGECQAQLITLRILQANMQECVGGSVKQLHASRNMYKIPHPTTGRVNLQRAGIHLCITSTL
ncbi:hypothetical protein Vafri_9657 [Volvox africanus]|uniref:Uncharacterized protein n=1 Tax=Volvox africanus TaxID=51714 RepID=A0A8J4B5L4_9CHLO|nr:hypothetical protein Vafri_9657 [Volvox africanus]